MNTAKVIPVFAKKTSGPKIYPQGIFPAENRSSGRRKALGIQKQCQKYQKPIKQKQRDAQAKARQQN